MIHYQRSWIENEIAKLDLGVNPTAKGRNLENLAAHFFGLVPGVHAVDRNLVDYAKSNERDLWISHTQVDSGLPFRDPFLPVECKNQKRKISASDVIVFGHKIRVSGGHEGVMVDRNGLSGRPGAAAHKAIEEVLVQGIPIVVITVNDLGKITNTNEFVGLLTGRLGELRANKTYRSI